METSTSEIEDAEKQGEIIALKENTETDTVEPFDEAQELKLDPKVIDDLSVAVLTSFLPNLQKAKCTLGEVIQSQSVLLETVQQENKKFAECAAMTALQDTMTQARKYHAKLVNLKKEMESLSEKSFRLKKRALKLQQQKTREELMKEQEREHEIEREKKLVAHRPKIPPS